MCMCMHVWVYECVWTACLLVLWPYKVTCLFWHSAVALAKMDSTAHPFYSSFCHAFYCTFYCVFNCTFHRIQYTAYSIVKYYDTHQHLKHNWLLAYSGRGGSIEKWLLCKRNIAKIVNWSNSLLTEVVGRARLHMCCVMCVCMCIWREGRGDVWC